MVRRWMTRIRNLSPGGIGRRRSAVISGVALGLLFAAALAWRSGIEARNPTYLPEPISDPNTFEVVQAVPQGDLPAAAAREIVVSFSQPVIPLGKVDSSSVEPFKLDPPVSGRFRWYGSSVAAFVPSAPLEAGRSYSIVVPATLKDLEGRSIKEGRSFAFETQGLKLSYLSPGDKSTIDYNPTFSASFNLPVSADGAKGFIDLWAGGEKVDFRVQYPEGDDSSEDESKEQRLLIQPTSALPRGARVVLRLRPGLPMKGQAGGLQEQAIRNYDTYGPVSVDLEQDAKFFQDRSGIRLRFNNPVLPAKAFPFINLLDEKGQLLQLPAPEEDYNTTVLSAYDWPVRPGRSYTIVVKRGLPDAYGNIFAAEKKASFRMPAVRPYLYMEGGWHASEAMLSPRVPYSYGNLKEVRIDVATVGLEAILASLQTYQGPHAKLTFKRIPLPVNAGPNTDETRLYDFTSALNTTHLPGKKDKKTGWLAYRFEADVVNWQGERSVTKHEGVLQSTDLGLTVRESPYSAHVWVHSLSGGEPIQGLLIQSYHGTDLKGKCDTNEEGYCRIEKGDAGLAEQALFLAMDRRPGQGGDMAFVSSRYNRVYDGVQYGSARAGAPEMRGMLLFDRKLYRPGETVSFKAVVSVLNRGRLTPYRSNMGDVLVTINDSRGREVYKRVLKPTDQGGVTDTLKLAADTPLGHYNVAVRPNTFVGKKAGESMGGVWDNFQVEEFRPLTFTVSVAGVGDRSIEAPTPLRVEGRYLFGAAMRDAKASMVLYEQAASVPLQNFPDFETSQSDDSVEKILMRGQGRLDAKGSFTLEVPRQSFAPEKLEYLNDSEYQKAKKGNTITMDQGDARTLELRAHRHMRLEAKVFDAASRSVTKNADFYYYAADAYPALKPQRYVGEEGKDLAIDAVFVDSRGMAVSGKGTMHIFRSEWNNIETRGPGGSLQRRSALLRVLERTDSFDASGKKTYTFRPGRGGLYEIILRTSNGAFARTQVYVAGKGYGWWRGQGDDSVELIPDKKEYRPGERAKILIKSPFAKARAVLTVEREDVLEQRSFELSSSAQAIEVNLREDYIPSVHVSVMLFRPRTGTGRGTDADHPDPGKPVVKMGSVRLDLSSETKRIPVTVKKSCDPCGPRQEMEVEVRTAPNAEVLVDVADRAILDLVGYRFSDPIPRFYDARPYGIRVLDIRGALIDQFLRAGKGDEGGGGDESGSNGGFAVDGEDGMRKDFRYTAHWAPTLRADASGVVKVKFRLPDNLTTFRIMAIAAKDGTYGTGETEFRVQKSVVTMPILPNFVRPGDGVWAGALVINQTGAKGTFRFEFRSSPALCREDPSDFDSKDAPPATLTRDVKLDAGETREVLFYCKIPRNPAFLRDLRKETVNPLAPSFRLNAGSIDFKFRAAGEGDVADGMSRTVPLRQEVVREAFTISGTTTDAAKEGILFPDPVENPGEISIQMAGTALLGLKAGYDFFSLNPYLCLEQRSSAFLLHAMAGTIAPASTGGEYDPAKLNELFLGSLTAFQNEDGGLRLWKEHESTSDPYLTAYVLEVLKEAQNAGAIPASYQGRVDRITPGALRFVEGYRNNPRNETRFYAIETLTYLNYVLSLYGKGSTALVQSALAKPDELSLRGRGYALLTAAVLKMEPGPAGNKVIEDFQNRLSFSTRKIELRESLPFSSSRIFYSSGSTVAVWLRYLVERKLNPEFVAKIVQGMMGRNVFLSSSHSEAAIALALRRYAAAYEQGVPAEGVVEIDGKELVRMALDPKTPTARSAFGTEDVIRRLSLGSLSAVKPLRITNPAKTGRLYYNATLDYAVDYRRVEAKDEGIYLSREILNADMTPVRGLQLRRGEVYPVRLRVITRRPVSNFLLRDPLSSSTEIVNTAFATEGASLAAMESQGDHAWYDSPSMIEKRYDAYVLTDTYLSAGIHEFIYLVRPIQAGNTALPPAQAQAMYEPEVFGRTGGGIVDSLK